jgi:uncharacterized protein (TIGR03086 family)
VTTSLLRGGSRDEAIEFSEATVTGDPVEALRPRLADQVAAFSQPGVLELMLDHPNQPMLAKYLLGYRIVDLGAHAWDLAHALGQDETLDPVVVEYAWTFLQPLLPVIGRIGLFGDGPSQAMSDAAPLQTRMLDLTGRRP